MRITKQEIENFLNDPKLNEKVDKEWDKPLKEIDTMAIIPGTNFMSFSCPECGAWNSILTNNPIDKIKCAICLQGYKYIKK